MYIKSSHCTLYIFTVLFVNYTSIKLEEKITNKLIDAVKQILNLKK